MKTPLAPYAVLRMLLGLLFVWWLHTVAGACTLLYSDSGVLPGSLAISTQPALLSWVTTPGGVQAVYWIGMISALLFAAGCLTRWSGVVLYLCVLGFVKRNPYACDGATEMLLSLLFLLLLSPCGRRWSVDSRRQTGEETGWGGPLRLMQLQVALVYLCSGFYKLMSAAWLNGQTVMIAMGNPNFRHLDWWGMWPPGPVTRSFFLAFTWGVMVFELSFIVLVWWRRTRPYVLSGGCP